MSEYIHLIGAEQVQSAANAMRSAADDMQRAANQISESMLAQQRFLDDWLSRLDGTLSDRVHDMGQTLR